MFTRRLNGNYSESLGILPNFGASDVATIVASANFVQGEMDHSLQVLGYACSPFLIFL